MPKEYKFYLKLLAIPVLGFILLNLDIDKVSNIGDFIRGFVMAVIVIVMLWLVYSVYSFLTENAKK